MNPNWQIINADALTALRGMPEESVPLVVTSPPYDRLRDYGGHAWDFEGIAKELYRVMVFGGVICWVVANQVKGWNESLTTEKQRIRFQEIGFSVRKMIYFKLNFANPNPTFYHRLHEDITMCCKGSRPRVFSPIMDVPTVYKKALGRNTCRQIDGSLKEQKQGVYGEFAKRGDVWIGPTAGQENPCRPIEHPAKMPDWLANDLIVSWSNPSDLVLDPFCGSATTIVAALRNGREGIGIDINPEYCQLARRRIENDCPLFNTETN